MPDLVRPGQRLVAATTNARAPYTVDFSAITTNTPTGGTATTEVVWVTTPVLTLKNGRAYRLTVKGLLGTNGTGSEGQIRIRKGSVTGQVLFDSFRISAPNNGNYGFTFSHVISNQLGVDVNTVLVGGVFRSSGTTNVMISASTNNVAFIHTEDIGPVSDFPGCQALTA